MSERRHPGAPKQRDEKVAAAPEADGPGLASSRPNIGKPQRQPAQTEKQQDKRDDFHEELGQREIGGGKPDETDAGGKARAADQDERNEPVEFRQHRGCDRARSEEHTSELQSLMRISYAVFCLKKKKTPE